MVPWRLRLRSRHGYPARQVAEIMAQLSRDIAALKFGNTVTVGEWIEYVRKSPFNAEAMVRVMFDLAERAELTELQAAQDARDDLSVLKSRRTPIKPIRQGFSRTSQRLF